MRNARPTNPFLFLACHQSSAGLSTISKISPMLSDISVESSAISGRMHIIACELYADEEDSYKDKELLLFDGRYRAQDPPGPVSRGLVGARQVIKSADRCQQCLVFRRQMAVGVVWTLDALMCYFSISR